MDLRIEDLKLQRELLTQEIDRLSAKLEAEPSPPSPQPAATAGPQTTAPGPGSETSKTSGPDSNELHLILHGSYTLHVQPASRQTPPRTR